jgi:hypothetical protein
MAISGAIFESDLAAFCLHINQEVAQTYRGGLRFSGFKTIDK